MFNLIFPLNIQPKKTERVIQGVMHCKWTYEPNFWNLGRLENLKVIYFLGDKLCWVFRRGCISYVPGTFWPISYKIKTLIFPSLYLYFIKIRWNFFIFPNNFSVSLVFMLLSRSLDCYFSILLKATVLCMTLKDLVNICSW